MSGEQSLGKLVANVASIAASLAVLIREVPPNKAEAIVTASMDQGWLPEGDANNFKLLVNKYILPAVVKAVGDAEQMIAKHRQENER